MIKKETNKQTNRLSLSISWTGKVPLEIFMKHILPHQPSIGRNYNKSFRAGILSKQIFTE